MGEITKKARKNTKIKTKYQKNMLDKMFREFCAYFRCIVVYVVFVVGFLYARWDLKREFAISKN